MKISFVLNLLFIFIYSFFSNIKILMNKNYLK